MSNSSQSMTRERAGEIADDMLMKYIDRPWFVDIVPMKDDGGMHIEFSVTSLHDMLSDGVPVADLYEHGIRICLIQNQKKVDELDA